MNYELPNADNTLALEAGPDSAENSPPLDDLMQQRIAELRTHALAKINPMTANVSSVTAGLVEIATKLEKHILAVPERLLEADLARRPGDSLVDTYLRVTKQIVQFAQLGIKLDHVDRSHGTFPSPADLLASAGEASPQYVEQFKL